MSENKHTLFVKLLRSKAEGLAGQTNEPPEAQWQWQAADELERLSNLNTALLSALTAIGVLPNGYCFCSKDRDANKPEHEHTGECQAARTAIRRAQGGGSDG